MTDAPSRATPAVAIVGGGLAGLAAAASLRRRGIAVELFEAKRRLGGRVGSFYDAPSGRRIDYCQHAAMGCCTAWLEFCRETGIDDGFTRHRRLHFFGPDGRRCDFAARRGLPAPWHLLPGLFGLKYLSLRDRWSVVRAVHRLTRLPASGLDDRSVGDWLQRERQSPEAVERFWTVLLVSALGERLERSSLAAARKVVLDGFCASRDAYEVILPRTSFHEIYDRRLGDELAARGVVLHRGLRVVRCEGTADRVASLTTSDGVRREFDGFIIATPWDRVARVLGPAIVDAVPGAAAAASFHAAPITSAHLWFDRPITSLPHAVLVGRLSHWLFADPAEPGASGASDLSDASDRAAVPGGTGRADVAASSHHYQVVISASFGLRERSQESVFAEILADLKASFPDAASAVLLRRRLITEPAAVFSVRPGLARLRPTQATSVSNLALAGDWTQTGWPATMEGAVRSGRLAADALADRLA